MNKIYFFLKRPAKSDMHPKSWTLLEVHIFYVKEEKNQQKV